MLVRVQNVQIEKRFWGQDWDWFGTGPKVNWEGLRDWPSLIPYSLYNHSSSITPPPSLLFNHSMSNHDSNNNNATAVTPTRKHELLIEARRARSNWIRCPHFNDYYDYYSNDNATTTTTSTTTTTTTTGCTEKLMATSMVAQHMPSAENALKALLFGGGDELVEGR